MRKRIAVPLSLLIFAVLVPAASARVLRVGSFHGVRGAFNLLQAAVKAAHPGDWILLGPGDYKTRPDMITAPSDHPNFPAGVVITTPNLHIRGMNRNTVIIDGTKPGSAVCSRAGGAQNFGRQASGGSVGGYASAAAAPTGENGLMVYKAGNVSIENLTACNFLGGSAESGNQIWWNGGAGSAKVGGYGFLGTYLSTTSTYLKSNSPAGEKSAATYGIFSSNWSGGTWDHVYASNFNDSGFYIGACQQVCDQVLNHAHGQFNALGYSGSNSGGRLLIENSEFDQNKDGFDTNSQNGDDPAPQNGACPAGVKPPVAGAPTCWVFTRNFVHDNNNPNVPYAGTAGAGPVGTGMSLSGARNDTIMNNRFERNNAWGVIIVPFTDSGKPCIGGTLNSPFASCLFDEWGNHMLDNTFTANGGYRNPTNGEFDQLNLESHPSNCFAGNRNTGGSLGAEAAKLQSTYPTCSSTAVPANLNVPFLNEVLCDSQVKFSGFGCQKGDYYPRRRHVIMRPLARQTTMPNPCRGVPANPWCPRRRHA